MTVKELENMTNEYTKAEKREQVLKDMCDKILETRVEVLEREILNGDYNEKWIALMQTQSALHRAMIFSADRCFFSASKSFTYSMGGYTNLKLTITITDNQINYCSNVTDLENKLLILQKFIECMLLYEESVLQSYNAEMERIFQNIADMEQEIKNI